jgi:oxygen-independent coproporphyrinogen-3 oxidase
MSPHLLSLYLHIPFCATRCGYCHFNTYEGLERLFEPYTDALCKELEHYSHALRETHVVHTIFIGGGTPTHLPIECFERLLQTLRAQWTWTNDIEITTEANPSSITQAYLERIHTAGVNRISFGAQAFDAELLRMLDREHTVAQIGEAVHRARHAGFTNLSLDLMYGLPTQTLTQWSDSLDAALALSTEHLSLYGLTIDEGTAFKKRLEQSAWPKPDDDLAADMYVLAEERLAGASFHQYEISNWARVANSGMSPKGDAEMADSPLPSTHPLKGTFSHPLSAIRYPPAVSRHNLTYWLNEPYIGLGPGAHSCFNHERFWNLNAPQVYIERLKRSESVVAGREKINTALAQAETVMLGLRLNEGITRARFAQRFGVTLDEIFGTTLKQCAKWELLDDDGECVRLTQRGRLLSNEVFQRLLPD